MSRHSADHSADYGRHGRLSPAQKMLTVAGSTLLIVATLAAGMLLHGLKPTTTELHAPYLIEGVAGQDLNARTFQARLLGARYATTIKTGSLVHDTQGVWVIISMRFTALDRPRAITYAAVHTRDGRTYLATDRISQALVNGSRPLQPGIPVEGEIAFEVPHDAVDGLTARFAVNQYELRMDAMTDIALPATTGPAAVESAAALTPAQVKP